MRIFRIKIYLSILVFFKAFFLNKINFNLINKLFYEITKKKFLFFTSQLRSSYLLVLLYLKKKYKNKNEILICSYNLKEMVNIPFQLNYKIVFYDIGKKGTPSIKEINNKINNRTSCVLLTNMYNDFNFPVNLKKICNKKKVILIEDCAITFDNFSKKKNKKIYSGSFGDYSLFSFNIMKNISAFYGGMVNTNDKDFIKYANHIINKNKQKFPLLIYFRQIIIFFLLKIFSFNFLYKNFFYYLFFFANKYKIKFIEQLIYPSLRFKKSNIPNFYLSRIISFSKKLIYLQLCNLTQRSKNHEKRKINNIYYFKKIKNFNSKNIELLNYNDVNFQNFLDFPLLFKTKNSIHNYLTHRGFELKKINYFDCSKLFDNKELFPYSNKYENELLCLPNHEKISFEYIDKLINEIKLFYKQR